MNNLYEKFENVFGTTLNIFGIALSVDDVSSALNLVLLIVSILSLVARCVFLVIDKVKRKDYLGAVDEIDKTKQEMDSLINKGESKDE